MTRASLQAPLDQLADEINDLLDRRTPEQAMALYEVLGMIEVIKEQRAEIEAEHIEGQVYGPEQGGLADRLQWKPGDVAGRKPEVIREVKDAQGNLVEVAYLDDAGREHRVYIGPPE